MLKRYNRFFVSLLFGHDVLVVVAAFWLAHALRFSFPALFPFDTVARRDATQWFFWVCVVAWPASAYVAGLYRSQRTNSVVGEAFRIFRASLTALVATVTTAYFFFEPERFSRGVLLLFTVLSFVLVTLGRFFFRLALRRLRARGLNLRYLHVVGTGELAEKVLATVHNHSELGLRAHGVLATRHEDVGREIGGVRVLSHVDDIARTLREHPVDQVIIALPIEELGGLKQLMDRLSLETVDVRVVPDLYQYATLGRGIEEFGGLPIVALQDAPLYGWNSVLKRLFDVLLSSALLLLCLPLFIAVAVSIRLAGRGPIFYSQERMGLDGRIFRMYKFRTMKVSAANAPQQMTSPDDDRRTRVGVFLRQLSLDELPQFWNVLTGDMSVVGPRPEQPAFIESFKQQIPKYHLRHKMKAGITGWAQIHGLRGMTSIEKRIEFDLYYIEHWSLGLDFRIVVKTVFGGFLSRNAY